MMMEPKIRFKGFSGEWKTQQIGDIATFSKGKGYSKADLVLKAILLSFTEVCIQITLL